MKNSGAKRLRLKMKYVDRCKQHQGLVKPKYVGAFIVNLSVNFNILTFWHRSFTFKF